MKKKNIAGLIVVIAIAVAVMFSGCVEKELGSIGGAPAINNPEDAIKAYIYYVNKGDCEKAAKLLVTDYPDGTALTKDEINELKETYKSHRSYSEITYENLTIIDVECQSILTPKSCQVKYKVTEKDVGTGKVKGSRGEVCIGTLEFPESRSVIETEDGWKILVFPSLDPHAIVCIPDTYSCE